MLFSSQEKLDKAAEAFEAADDLHAAFIARMDKWMTDNFARAIDLFRRFDVDGDGSLSYDEFYAGMRDLNAPANNLELYVLAKRLDNDANGMLDYLEFSKGLRYYKKEECVKDDGLPVLRFEREKLEQCPCCKLGLWKPTKEKFPRYEVIVATNYYYTYYINFSNNMPYTITETIVNLDDPETVTASRNRVRKSRGKLGPVISL